MKTKNWILLAAAATLLGVSFWVLMADYPSEITGRAVLMNSSAVIARQGIGSFLALLLAFGIGQFLPARQITRFWWLPLVLFGLLPVVMAISVWAGMDRIVCGTHWWQRSSGLIVTVLALISGLSFALPRFACGKRGGIPALAGVLLFVLVLPLWFLGGFPTLFLLLAMLCLCLWISVRGSRLWISLGGSAILFSGTVAAYFLLNPRSMERMERVLGRHENFQLLMSMFSINSGGLTGCRGFQPNIPEWHTDFIFGRLCGMGGIFAGLAVLLLTGLLLTLIWQITARRRNPRSRVLAAGCAAALTVQPLFYVAINLGLWPTMSVHFPFLSYGPSLLRLDGILLGILLSLDRETDTEEPVPARWPTTVVILGMWLLLLLFSIRLHTLVFNSPHLSEMRAKHAIRIKERLIEKTTSIRGRILDTNGRVLAQTAKSFTVCADPRQLVESAGLDRLPELARLIGMEETMLTERITASSRRYMRLLNNVPAETAESIRRMNIQGTFIETAPARDYPADVRLAHMVGYVLSWEELRGGGGAELIQNKALEKGQDIRLTLDLNLQTAVQQIAESAAVETKASQIQIIVMNPRTGAIRAAAQVPAVHGKNSATADAGSLNWRAVIDVFEPGGLIKPLIVASTLESGVITNDTSIDCENGTWIYCGVPLRDAHPFGKLTPEEILIRSSNIGMAKIGLMLSKQPLYDSLVKWGLSEKCSVGGFGGAPAGLLYPPARWSELEITRIPIGHSCSFSVFQILRAYTAFFNDGGMVEPYLVESGNPVQLRSVLKPETAAAVRDMLAKVVEKGTGQAARIDGVPVFGETAIIQKLTPDNRGYSSDKVQTAFIGGFERNGTPVLVVVWMDEPDLKESKHQAAAVFRNVAAVIMESYFD